jgi:glycine/D-amino acid oxidase-like deaminating enzyme
MKIDYLIIGQGISGSFLSYYLNKKGKSFIIIDNNKPNSASKVASGLINPITGRRYVKTWMIETIMPFAVGAYKFLETELNVDLIKKKTIVDFFTTPQMKTAFEDRLANDTSYISKEIDTFKFTPNINFAFDAGTILPSYIVDINSFLDSYKQKLHQNNQIIETNFEESLLSFGTNCIFYKDIKASKIIFCDGITSANNKWFKNLPFSFNKGEALLIKNDSLDINFVYKQGISILPIGNNNFWVGSSYQWNFEDDAPSDAFYNKTILQLQNMLTSNFLVENHLAAIRPANIERRPFVGLHPIEKNVGIFNGMGAKGCSLAPYFAHEFANNLVDKKPLNPLVDVARFTKILSQEIN